MGDGRDYEKYAHNPVLDEKDLPKGSSRYDFRDPKMWQRADGTYLCVVGNRPADGSGQVVMFESTDGFQWKFKKVLAENQGRFGLMWECPDFFFLDGKAVLITSPQDMLPKELEYHNGNGTLCLIGDYDKETDTFTQQHDQSIDYGIDFYAPQTILTPDGRRIMIGWMQNWDTCTLRNTDLPWFGQMSLPRELSIKNGRLYQQPLRELEGLRCNRAAYKNVVFHETTVLPGIKGRRIDMELSLAPGDAERMYEKFAVRFAQNDRYYTAFSVRPKESVLKIDRKFSGTRKAIIHQRRSLVNAKNGELKLRLILDRFSAELFINDGEQTMTAVIYTDLDADGISFYADGSVRMDIVKFDLEEKEYETV